MWLLMYMSKNYKNQILLISNLFDTYMKTFGKSNSKRRRKCQLFYSSPDDYLSLNCGKLNSRKFQVVILFCYN